jgi:hypothetical protein
VTSLVLGLILCFPILTGLGAIAFGTAGIGVTRSPLRTGRGLAIAGVVLGIVNLLVWTVGGTLWWTQSSEAASVAHRFTQNLAAGDLSAAQADTVGMKVEQLSGVYDQLKDWGTLTDVTLSERKVGFDSATTAELGGTATFNSGGTRRLTLTLVKTGGQYRVTKFYFR